MILYRKFRFRFLTIPNQKYPTNVDPIYSRFEATSFETLNFALASNLQQASWLMHATT